MPKKTYSWRDAESKMSLEVEGIRKLIPDYSYSDKDVSLATDGKVCNLLVDEIKKLKTKTMDVVGFLFELQREESAELQKIRDELDIFSDEIKIRVCRFKGMTQGFVEKLIRHDFELIEGLRKLNRELEWLQKKAAKSEDPLPVERVHEHLISIVNRFKEREAVCNIREVSLSRTYKKIQEEIREPPGTG
jgi:hypothetical protein